MPASRSSLSICHRPTSMAASKTPSPPGRMAGKAEQRRRNENHRDHDEAEIGLVRHQHIHRQRAEAEIDDADGDLQQRQRAARQHHGPGSAADGAGLHPDPGHIAHQGERGCRSPAPG